MKNYLCAILIICPVYLGAYETRSHSILTTHAVQESVLDTDPELLPDLGFDFTTRDAFLASLVPANSDGSDPDTAAWLSKTSIIRVISGGSVMEDAGKRSRHHFYDPQNGGSSGTAGLRSADWILETVVHPVTGVPAPVTLPGQEYSYRDALEYFYQSLTLADDQTRRIFAGLMFRSLGHVVHHLQDMAQPQHVRNDAHCDATSDFPGIALFCLFLGQHNPSFFEKYTNQRINSIDLGNRIELPGGIRTVRDFWDNVSGSGAAQLTSLNFVSDATNFQSQDGISFKSHPGYPSPMPLQDLVPVELSQLLLEDTFMTPAIRQAILRRTACSFDPEKDCIVNFIQSRGTGEGNQAHVLSNPRSSSISIFDEELRSRNIEINDPFLPSFIIKRLITLNRYNFESIYPFVLPLAVSYSTGLIDHFFRGRLEFIENKVVDNHSTLITVRNVSTPGTDFRVGNFELYYDSESGVRKAMQYSVHSGELPLKVGDTLILRTKIPEDVDESASRPYFVIFDARAGQIGPEPGIAVSRFQLLKLGRVSSLLSGVFVCPEKIFGIRISFLQQPEHNGQVLLRGNESSAQLDFHDVQMGVAAIKDEARWMHGIDESTGEYVYEVTYNFPQAEINTCLAPSLGPWRGGEGVTAE
jgi:hypothetical protein